MQGSSEANAPISRIGALLEILLSIKCTVFRTYQLFNSSPTSTALYMPILHARRFHLGLVKDNSLRRSSSRAFSISAFDFNTSIDILVFVVVLGDKLERIKWHYRPRDLGEHDLLGIIQPYAG